MAGNEETSINKPDNFKDMKKAAEFLYRFGKLSVSDAEKLKQTTKINIEPALKNLALWGTAAKDKKGDELTYYAPKTRDFSLGEQRSISNIDAFMEDEWSKTLNSKSPLQKILIYLAGSAFNLISAMIVFILLFTLVGSTVATLKINEVDESLPAYAAGIKTGDTITSLDGLELNDYSQMQTVLAEHKAGDSVKVGYIRGEEAKETSIKLAESEGRIVLGVTLQSELVKQSVPEALVSCFSYMGMMIAAVASLFNPFVILNTLSNSASLIGISVAAKQAAETGWINFIWLSTILSISLGVMNLIPLLPFDGGKIVVEIYQKIRKKAVSLRFISGFTAIGLIWVAFVFIFVIGQDFTRFIIPN
jgi:regulator of sigma E protease